MWRMGARRHRMATVIDILLCLSVAVSVMVFAVFYSYRDYRCNAEFGDQMHCVSGIILCNKPLFGFLVHGVGGMVLLAAGLKVSERDWPETSLLLLAMMYVSLSGVVSFDVRDFKPLHFTSLAGVLGFSIAFVCMQCDALTRAVYVSVSVVFALVILFNFAYMRWRWPWMDVQASVEIVWVLCLLVCIMLFCLPALQPRSWQTLDRSPEDAPHAYNNARR